MRFILEGKPVSTNVVYRRHGNVMYMSKDGKDLKESYQWQIKSVWKGKPLSKPLTIVIGLYFKDKLRRDIDNWHKVLLDAFTGIVWEDDSQIQKMVVTKNIDKSNPRIELEIL